MIKPLHKSPEQPVPALEVDHPRAGAVTACRLQLLRMVDGARGLQRHHRSRHDDRIAGRDSSDGYQLVVRGAVLVSLGLFELFIGDLDVPENHPFRRALVIDSLDDLKGKLATVIVMLLIVKFFEKVQGLEAKNYYDLLALAGGVALLGFG